MPRSRKPAAKPAFSPWPHYDQPPCPRCLTLAQEGALRAECVMPLPPGALAPRAYDRTGPCCHDCAAADSLVRSLPGMDFEARRVATGNERQENMRRPESVRHLFGLFQNGQMRSFAGKNPATLHHHWMDRQGIDWLGAND